MNKVKLFLFFTLPFILIACSSNDELAESGAGSNDEMAEPAEGAAMDMGVQEEKSSAVAEEENAQVVENASEQNRMVMYNAHLTLEVKDIPKFIDLISNETETKNGYIVESTTTNYDDHLYAFMSVRIPSEKLNAFLESIESESEGVTQREIHGSDVTEEYTDLQSRLKAKKAVEERLLSFMKDADKTEDLLKISDDLSVVQEEIEQIEGRKKYLENRTEYASVDISLEDISVHVPDVQEEDLQTGSKIKQAFMESLNFLAQIGSWFVVFFVGYSPIVVPLILILLAILIYRKKRRKKE